MASKRLFTPPLQLLQPLDCQPHIGSAPQLARLHIRVGNGMFTGCWVPLLHPFPPRPQPAWQSVALAQAEPHSE